MVATDVKYIGSLDEGSFLSDLVKFTKRLHRKIGLLT